MTISPITFSSQQWGMQHLQDNSWNSSPVLLLKFPQLCVHIKSSTKVCLPLLVSILRQISERRDNTCTLWADLPAVGMDGFQKEWLLEHLSFQNILGSGHYRIMHDGLTDWSSCIYNCIQIHERRNSKHHDTERAQTEIVNALNIKISTTHKY